MEITSSSPIRLDSAIESSNLEDVLGRASPGLTSDAGRHPGPRELGQAALKPSARAREQTTELIARRANKALTAIVTAIQNHPRTGQTRRLVRFIAGCYNGSDYPFDLTDLRGLDTSLAQACLDYLDYDRLAIREIHHYLPCGERMLHRWLRDYDIRVVTR